MNSIRQIFYAIFIVLFSIPASFAQTDSGRGEQTPAADHHIHIRSEAGTDALVRILEKVRNRTGVEIRPSTDADLVIGLLDSAGVRKAALLSTAYFFEMPEVEFDSARIKTRRENEYVARQAALYPDRLAAFCGLNPLAGYALEEVERCGTDGRVEGIKLHFANSDVDLRNREHVKQVAAVFEAANRLDLALVVHLWTRNPDYGRRDVELFVEEILPAATDVAVQIAHLGGPSGFGAATDSASAAFADAIANDNPALENIWFDLAAVPADPGRAESEEQQAAIREANRELARRIRQIGPERVLWGTDWIAGPVRMYTAQAHSIPLPEDLLRILGSNSAPYLR